MKIFTPWLRSFLPPLDADDRELAEALTLRGIAGEGVEDYHDAAGDSDGALYDMDITTNRVDAMNHYGVAREAAAIHSVPLHRLDTHLPEPAGEEQVTVRIEAPDLCGRFTARVLRGVRIAPSDGLTAERFQALGLKRISNAVDATNATLHGMGHPTHAFDLDKVEGGIVVRRAFPGEMLRLLDGTTRTLVEDDLVVADDRKALGLAGVMGGWDSMITAETRNILVEAAWFAPAAVRRSARRHGLHTDASHRFERGADFAAAPVANALVCQHILASAGGTLAGPLVDVVVPEMEQRTVHRVPVRLALAQVHRHLGRTAAPEGITAALTERFLTALGCRLQRLGEPGDVWQVELPSWRLDLEREIDLIEEIARVYGYNGFANTLPTPAVVRAEPTAAAAQAVYQQLLALGYTQSLSSSFASPAAAAEFCPGTEPVALENPLNEELSLLRPSLLPGMAEALAHNLTRDVLSARLFETGTVFVRDAALAAVRGGEVREAQSLALGLTGMGPASSLATPEDAPFFELKGAVEAVLRLFTADIPTWAANDLSGFVPGRVATVAVGGRPVGLAGQYRAPAARKLRQPVWLAQVDLHWLLEQPLRRPMAADLSRFQAVERDFSFVFPETVPYSSVEAAVRGLKLSALRTLQPVERWSDPKKTPGVYALLLRATFQSSAGTLTEAEIAETWSRIITALTALGGTLRDR